MRRPSPGSRAAIRRSGTAATLSATLLAVAGCQFDTPPLDDTMYMCRTEAPSCPDDFTCIQGVCRPAGAGPDAATADAGPVDPGAPDARIADAGLAADAGTVTVTFGDRSSAGVRGVTADTSIYSGFPADPHGSDLELTVDGSPAATTLLRFDLATIPAGATVTAASLVVAVFDPLVGGTASADALTVAWAETSATWAQASAGTAWPSAGAGGSAIGATLFDGVPLDPAGEYELTVATAVVQGWVDEPGRNFGMRWRSSNSNNLRLRSREGDDASRPLLRVTYQPR